jgi:hypothetical protein
MFTPLEKVHCVLLLAKHKSVISVQHTFRCEFNKDPPHENNIRQWFNQSEELNRVLKQTRMGRSEGKKLKENDLANTIIFQ